MARITSIVKSWNSIRAWFDKNWHEKVDLPKGVNAKEIAGLEDMLGFPIPKDVSQSYQIHNGSGQLPLLAFDSYQIPFPIASISTMRAQWAFIQKGLNRGSFTGTDFVNDPQGPIQKVWFHSKWLPVVDNQGGDYVFVDLAPAKGGKKGQVIDFFRHKGASHVLAPSFSELLEGIATDLDSGKFRVDKKAKSLVAVRSGK